MSSREIEGWIILLGLIALWLVYSSNAYTYVYLSVYQKVDILIPFKVFILVGFGFTAAFSLIAIVYSLVDREGNYSGLVLIAELVLLTFSVISSYLTVPAILNMQSQFQISDVSIRIGCIIGVILGLIGLIFITYYSLKD